MICGGREIEKKLFDIEILADSFDSTQIANISNF